MLSVGVGCKLGEASEFLVNAESRIQVPVRSGQAGCYEVCVCGPGGRLESCEEMPCVDTFKTCLVGDQRKSTAPSSRRSLTLLNASPAAYEPVSVG